MAGEPILVVDDNPTNLRLLRLLLSGESYAVRTAGDAGEALAVLKEFRPRLILLDLQMPGMDGFELARRLKSDTATQDIVIVALTAYAMKGDEERARQAGCDGYVSKPIDTRALPAIIARHLERANPEASA
jgi:two-component system, cell cycle response regulator DivK